jgi:hypothetical protein
MTTLKEAAQRAVQVQDACNLSGVLHSWAALQRPLMELCGGNATDKYRQHPLNVLFMSKVAALMGVRTDAIGGTFIGTPGDEDYKDLFRAAYTWALDVTREPEVPDAVVQSIASWARTPELFQEKLRQLRYHAGDNFWSFTVAGMFVGVEPDGYMHT